MKNKRYLIAITVIGILALTSCQKDKYYLFNDVARIQFGPEPSRIYQTSFDFADTLKLQTFYYYGENIKEDTVFFDIYAIGGTRNTDRSFTLSQEQISGATNAEPGKHYVAFTDPRVAGAYVIKAGTVHARVPVILLRDASLKTTTPVLKFVVQEDKNFQLGELTKTWRKVEFTDRLSQPSLWDATMSTYYFGKYSNAKHNFMIQSTGDKWDNDFFQALRSDLSFLAYCKTVLTTALIDYNKAHPGNPLTDEFGEPVVFP